jgi:hypothetical protein
MVNGLKLCGGYCKGINLYGRLLDGRLRPVRSTWKTAYESGVRFDDLVLSLDWGTSGPIVLRIPG